MAREKHKREMESLVRCSRDLVRVPVRDSRDYGHVHALVTPSWVPLIATLALRSASLMPNPTTTGSPILDYLIDKVELASHIDVWAQDDFVDTEAVIDNCTVTKVGIDDDTQAIASSSHSFL
ncbi:hypothetical protein Ancab_014682 [Ancistrocladus abbreviatus]